MTDVVSVKFKGRGKTYFFDPNGVEPREGDQVVVETSKGLELAECVQGPHTVTDERIVPPLRPIVRVATADDLRVAELGKAREKEAFEICEKKIAEHGLDMKLVDVECNFEGNKILFFFTSDGRVDFRELVKDLASVFRARIELRQIGVRDEAKMLGGLGICGRPFCCHAFLDDFEPVSTKMAKTQSLSLNPAKISGSCGRLMCCLRYEQDAYEELVKTVPKNGAFVQTPCGYGNVCQVNLLRQKVKVKIDGVDEAPRTFEAGEVAAIPGGRPKAGEPLPDILVVKPKEPEEELTAVSWERPPMFAEETAVEGQVEEVKAETEQKKSGRSRSRGNRGRGGRRPQSEAPAAEKKQGAEKPKAGNSETPGVEGGEQPQKNNRSRSRNHRGSGKGQGSAQPEQKQPAQKAAENKPAQPKKPQGEAPKAEGGEQAKKKSSNHHRRYRGRPNKNKGGGGTAPKAE